MSQPCDQIQEALEAAVAGRFDDLRDAQVAALETHLASCDRCADLLAAALPAPDAVARGPSFDPPSAEEWAGVWQGVAAASRRDDRVRTSVALGRWTRYGAIAAALVCAIAVWRMMTPGRADWAVQLSSNVEVQEIEVFGDTTSFVSLSDDGGAAMIWVVQENGAGDA